MSEIEKTFFGLRIETATVASMIFNRAVNFYGDLVRKAYSVRKPVVIDGKKQTKTSGSDIVPHILISTSSTGKEMSGSVAVDQSDPQILRDARIYETYPGQYGIGPFGLARMNFMNKDMLRTALRDSGKPHIVIAGMELREKSDLIFEDLEVH